MIYYSIYQMLLSNEIHPKDHQQQIHDEKEEYPWW